jgi:hypothetical protein
MSRTGAETDLHAEAEELTEPERRNTMFAIEMRILLLSATGKLIFTELLQRNLC